MRKKKWLNHLGHALNIYFNSIIIILFCNTLHYQIHCCQSTILSLTFLTDKQKQSPSLPRFHSIETPQTLESMSPSVDGPAVSACSCFSGENGYDREKLDDRRSCEHCRRSSRLPSSSSSCSLLSLDPFPVAEYDKPWRIFSASVKGFAIGAGLKGGLALFAILARLRRRRLLTSAK